MRVTSLSKLAAVLLLLERPRHGYELIKEIKDKFKYPVSAGQVYPFLSSLSRAKFVKIEKSGSRDKKVYTLTPAGREFSNNMLKNFDELIELALSKKVHKCCHCGCKVLGKGHTVKKGGKKLHFCCPSCARSFFNKSGLYE